jgi:di/tricarboxylate transporter
LALGFFAAAVGVASAGWVPLVIAFLLAAVAMILGGAITLREAYDGVEWPVIVLLGAMIPLGGALETTGATHLVAASILSISTSPTAVLALLLIVTMTLSDVMNNAATAVMLAPIAAAVAEELQVDADPLLMAVAVGASCAFLTPVGHQNNTLILGPGGYRFGDYWRVGLPLEILIVAIAVPLIPVIWPF